MPSIADIANGLTEAQRRAVLSLGSEYRVPPRGLAYPAATLIGGVRLTEYAYLRLPSSKRVYRLTQLGKQVRAHLEKNP